MRQSVERRPPVIDLDAQLRDEHLLFDLQIHDPGHGGKPLAGFLGEAAQGFEVVAENLQHDLRANARLQMIEPMADRLTDRDRNRQHRELLADVRIDFGLRSCRAREVHIDFAEIDALGMLVEFGAAGAAPDRFHFGNLRKQTLGDEAEPMRLRKRNSGIVLDRKHQRAFVEGRQEAARQQCCEITRDDNGDRGSPDHDTAVSERPLQQHGGATLETPHHKIVALLLRAACRTADSTKGPE